MFHRKKWRRKKQNICNQMDAVQMDCKGMSNWTQIQIDSESPLIWTVRFDKCPNKCPYTINLDVQNTLFGLGQGPSDILTLFLLHVNHSCQAAVTITIPISITANQQSKRPHSFIRSSQWQPYMARFYSSHPRWAVWKRLFKIRGAVWKKCWVLRVATLH